MKPKQKSRRSGGNTIAYLPEKNDLVQNWKEEELYCKSNKLKLRVNWKISQENNIRI